MKALLDDLFTEPNPGQTQEQFCRLADQELRLTGMLFVWTPRSSLGVIDALYVLPTTSVAVVGPTPEQPGGRYVVHTSLFPLVPLPVHISEDRPGFNVTLPPEDVIVIRSPGGAGSVRDLLPPLLRERLRPKEVA